MDSVILAEKEEDDEQDTAARREASNHNIPSDESNNDLQNSQVRDLKFFKLQFKVLNPWLFIVVA